VGSATAVLQPGARHTTSLICNENSILLVFREEHLWEFFSMHPGVLLCLLEAHFVL
jgi:hypothetical protein